MALHPTEQDLSHFQAERDYPLLGTFPVHLQENIIEIHVLTPQRQCLGNAKARVEQQADERVRPLLRHSPRLEL